MSAGVDLARELLNRASDPWTEIENGNHPLCRERSNSEDGWTPCGAPATRIAAGILVCENCARLYSASSSISEAKKEHWAIVHNLIERALDALSEEEGETMAIELDKRWYVELEPGVWLASGDDGDPPRTLVREDYAESWTSQMSAVKALEQARQYRPFPNAKVVLA